MSEHRRKPPMPANGGRTAARRNLSSSQGAGRRPAPTPRISPEATPAMPAAAPATEKSHSRFKPYAGRTAMAGVLLAATAFVASGEEPQKQETQTVAADSVPHAVYRTGGEGLYLHDGPGLDTPLLGTMPDGMQFTVDCFTLDDPVNGNPVWLEGTAADGRHGSASDYYIDTHWNTTQDLVNQGIEQCGTQAPAASAPEHPEQPQPQSIFYSPLAPPTGLHDVSRVADINRALGEWSTGDCRADKASENIPESIRTLSGWSVGRMGPIYFLASASEAQKSRIKNIVLLDPGDTSSFAARKVLGIPVNERCDDDYNVNQLLGSWLSKPDTNLTIVTGRTTEEKENSEDPGSKSTFAGLWKYYLADIWEKPFADRAKICDYNYMDHEEIMRKFAAKVIAEPTVCPEAPERVKLTEWHP